MQTSKGVVLKNAVELLDKNNLDTNIAYLLFDDLFGLSKAHVMSHLDMEMEDEERILYERSLKKIIAGIPYHYAVGFQHFFGHKIRVSEDVLIPRNETEELVQFVIDNEKEPVTLVDIGTGSGAIAIALALNTEHEVIMTDVSSASLNVAIANSLYLGADVTPYLGDLFEPLIQRGIKVDCIVSNPPYISYDEESYMSKSTLEHEPHGALFASDGGLFFYKAMVDQLQHVLNDGGRVYFEIGFKQKERLINYVKKRWPKSNPRVIQDINGNDRILYFKWEV